MKSKVLVSLVIILLLTGCIRKSEKAPPKVYVTPCTVIGEDILLMAKGEKLGPDIIKSPLASAFVDDLLSVQAKGAWDSYNLNCWWGKNVGEQRDLYYCGGSYVVPEVNEENVITRYLLKEFKIGFEISEHPATTWREGGKEYAEGPFYYLTVKSVSATCSIA